VQIRSHDLEIHVSPIPLDRAFPICGGEPFVQTDRPITYLHVHDCLEVGYCYSGRGIFVVGEKVLTYEAGDVAFIHAAEVHLASSAPGTDSHWIWIYLDPVRLVGSLEEEISRFDPVSLSGPGFHNILRPEAQPDVGRVVLRMIEELQAARPGAKSALRALSWELLVLMSRIAPGAETLAPRPDYERLAPALNRLSSGYTRPLKVGELARCCGLSEPHFRRLFKVAIGRSPRTYWNDLRLQMATSLLRGTGRSVLEISQDVGFETLSSFNRLFKTRFGQSPRSWRKATPNH